MDNFENIQLYRSNVHLGGNMKYDLVLDDTGEKLFVKDFHITPISGQDPVNMDYEEYLFKSTHQDNIKYFYNSLSGSSFYKDKVDPYIDGQWPLIFTNCNLIQTYDDNWFMGCKRMTYSKYKKQFEFLVPLWIEKYDQIDFVIELWTTPPNNPKGQQITSKTLTLYNNFNSPIKNCPEYHKAFCNYMLNYAQHIGLANYKKNVTKVEDGKLIKDDDLVVGGSNDIMNIDLYEKTAYIHGLNILTCQPETKGIYDLGHQLTAREIPMMDFNQKIIESFSKYKFISKQLFNFNLCFNIQDIASANVCKELMYENLKIKVKVKIGNKYLPIKDFLTNYEYHSKTNIYQANIDNTNIPDQHENVFDFLKDYRAIDYMYTNKMTQQIPFWSLVDNSDYIFNTYSGYAGRTKENNGWKQLYSIFKDSFDPNILKYTLESNNIFWAHFVNLEKGELLQFLTFLNLRKHKFTPINKWMKHTKYDVDDDTIQDLANNNITKIALIKSEDGALIKYHNKLTSTNTKSNNQSTQEGEPEENTELKPDSNDTVYIYYRAGTMFFIANDLNCLTFKYIKNNLSNAENKNDVIIGQIQKLLNSLILPKTIRFSNGLSYSLINHELKSIKEIEYFKNDDYDNYVLRYDGKIRPSFVDTNINGQCLNMFYYKDVVDVTELNKSKYVEYSKLGYDPVFPSIDYYSIKSLPLDHEKYPNFEDVNEQDNVQKDGINNARGNMYEYRWFNDGRHLLLPVNIDTIYKTTKKEDLYEVIIEFFANYLPSYESDSLIITKEVNGKEKVFEVPIKILNIMNLYYSNINILSTWKDDNDVEWYELDIKLELK